MTRCAYTTGLAITLFCGLACADDKDGRKVTATTEGKVVIEINGQPHIIELNAAPETIKKQVKIVTENLSKNGGKPKHGDKSKNGSSSGSFSFHTIIVGTDGAVTEEKFKKVLDGKVINDKEFLKNVPEAVRKQMMAAIKQGGLPVGIQLEIESGENPGGVMKRIAIPLNLDALLKGNGKELQNRLGPEVRKQLLEAMKGIDAKGMTQGSFQGHAVVIGPDGKKQEFRFGNDQEIKQSPKKLQAAVKKGATKSASSESKASASSESKAGASSDDNIAKALNQILNRLDKIEADLQTLKKGDKGAGK